MAKFKKFPEKLYVYYDPDSEDVHFATENMSEVVTFGDPLQFGAYTLSERGVAVATVEFVKHRPLKKKKARKTR